MLNNYLYSMVRRRFDIQTRRLFDQIQMKIFQINGRLFSNPTLHQKDSLLRNREILKTKGKEFKKRFYKTFTQNLLTESLELIKKIKNSNLDRIRI